MLKITCRFVVAFLLLVCGSVLSIGQTGSSRIGGTVTDNVGAVVQGAKVTVTNEATGVEATQVTTSDGVYSFASLPAGRYTIVVEQTGFKRYVKTGNVVQVDSPSNVDITLEAGNVTETVTVQAEGITVQTTTATVGDVVDQRTIETLPLNGRNPLALVLLEPGVVQRSFGGVGSGIHINGSRDRAYNVTIDGIDANESSVPNPVSNLYRLNPDNVQEFKVTTNNATAEEGRNSGASISLSTRSGGNALHGTAFWFIRNDALNTEEWFGNALNQDKRTTKLHQFGFELSGPIIKKKTFFFGSWQQNRVDFTQPIDQSLGAVPIVYTASAKAGTFRYFRSDPLNPLVINGTTITRNSPLLVNPATGALRSDIPICANSTQLRCVFVYNVATGIAGAGLTLNSSVASYLNTLPTPNNFNFGDGLNTAGFLWNPPTAIRGPAYNVRIDHNLNDKMSIFGRYLYSDYNTLKGDPLNSRPQIFPGFAPLGEVFRKTSNFVTGFRWNISTYTTNDFRFGYSKFNFLFTQGEANPDFPNVSPVNFNSIDEPYNNTPRTQREVFTPQFIDDFTVVHGEHVIGMGLNFRFYRHRDVRGQPGGVNVTPAISMDPSIRAFPSGVTAAPGINGTDNTLLQNLIANLAGRPARISQVFIGDLGNDVFLPFIDSSGKVSLFDERHIANQYNVYVQDEWKAQRNLTLDLGLRWEYNPPAHTQDGKTFVPDGNILAGPVTFVPADSWYKNEKAGVFGPSLGLVWGPEFKKGFFKSLFGEPGKSAIRLGYRIAYDTISTFQVTAAAGRVPGLLVSCSATYPLATGGTITVTPGCVAPTNPDATLGNGFPTQLQPSPTVKPSSFFRLPTQSNTNAPPITVFAPEMKTPTVHQWSLSWQRELPWKMVVQAAYVGRRGIHLFYARNMNQINPDAIMPSFLLMQENMRRGCLPAGTGPLVTGGICTNPITSIPLLAPGTGITSGIVNASAAVTQISPGVTVTGTAGTTTFPVQNAAGAFAERVENNTLFFGLRPNQQFGVITYLDNSGDSNYHAAQFTLRRRFASGLGLTAAYTFARSIDNQSVDPVGSASGGGLSTTTSRAPADARNLQFERARSDFDRRHVFTMATVWDVPIGKSRYYFSSAPGWLNEIIGNWTINGISTWMTGEPFSVRSGSRTSNSGHESYADIIDPTIKARLIFPDNVPGPVLFQNANAFAVPRPGSNGAGRNFFFSPGYYNLDLGIVKTFSITERIKLDFRTEMFNVLNHANFDNPRDASVGSPSIQSSVFAQSCCQAVAPPSTQTIIQTGESARVIQFALKLKF